MKIFLIAFLTIIGFLFLQNIIVPQVSAQTPVYKDKLYWITGNLTLNENIDVKGKGVIFVDGDLFINKNQTGDTSTTGLVFIVKGAIYIAPSVTQINAFMISYTDFCTAWDGTLCQDNTVVADQKFLTINGSVIFLNPSTSPQFVREKYDATQGAETLNYQPKYLVILRDIFARDLKIWKEVQ